MTALRIRADDQEIGRVSAADLVVRRQAVDVRTGMGALHGVPIRLGTQNPELSQRLKQATEISIEREPGQVVARMERASPIPEPELHRLGLYPLGCWVLAVGAEFPEVLEPCRECDRPIPYQSPECPHCGAAQPTGSRTSTPRERFLRFTGALLGVPLFGVGVYLVVAIQNDLYDLSFWERGFWTLVSIVGLMLVGLLVWIPFFLYSLRLSDDPEDAIAESKGDRRFLYGVDLARRWVGHQAGDVAEPDRGAARPTSTGTDPLS